MMVMDRRTRRRREEGKRRGKRRSEPSQRSLQTAPPGPSPEASQGDTCASKTTGLTTPDEGVGIPVRGPDGVLAPQRMALR